MQDKTELLGNDTIMDKSVGQVSSRGSLSYSHAHAKFISIVCSMPCPCSHSQAPFTLSTDTITYFYQSVSLTGSHIPHIICCLLDMASAETRHVIQQLKQKDENNFCFECGAHNPAWASVKCVFRMRKRRGRKSDM